MKKFFTLMLAFAGFVTLGVSLRANATAPATESKDFSTLGYSNAVDVTDVQLENCTLTFSKGSNSSNGPKYYNSGTAIRLYGGNTLTVSPKQDAVIQQIVITFSAGEGTNEITANFGVFNTDTWTRPSTDTESKNVVLTITGTSGQRRFKAIEVSYYDATSTTYDVKFDVNGGTFVAGKGTNLIGNAVGSDTNVTLPVASDLSATPCLNHTTLVGWNDGTTVHKPGASLTVSAGTIFKAVYSSPKTNTPFADVLAIANDAGATATAYDFTFEATIKAIKTAYDSTYKNVTVELGVDSNDETIVAFRMKGGEELVVNDVIRVTGKLLKYSPNQGNPYCEVDAGCTYKMIKAASETKQHLNLEAFVSADKTAVRYVGTITAPVGSTEAEVNALLAGMTLKMELFLDNGDVVTVNIDTVYLSVAGKPTKVAQTGVCYAVLKLTGITDAYAGKLLSARLVMSVDGSTFVSDVVNYVLESTSVAN